MTAQEIDAIAVTLEEKAAELRALAEVLRAPPANFTLTPPPGEEKRKTKSPPSPTYPSTLAAFGEAWHERYHQRWLVSPADRSNLGRLMRQLSPEEVVSLPYLFAIYLADEDPYVVAQGHSLRYFCGQFNRYRSKTVSADKRRVL